MAIPAETAIRNPPLPVMARNNILSIEKKKSKWEVVKSMLFLSGDI